jgi:hypothetical protein
MAIKKLNSGAALNLLFVVILEHGENLKNNDKICDFVSYGVNHDYGKWFSPFEVSRVG